MGSIQQGKSLALLTYSFLTNKIEVSRNFIDRLITKCRSAFASQDFLLYSQSLL
ncbi:hypothetical protein VIBNISOn1_290017 [Vibrio nigripulchritudo SOn1]|uniref:Transposase n=1 Tax=Vibrio nigripulchritudo SOn1 TaxID=1238450 RepID=A0AAV2VRG2_9VIBR|nr:hypothetical protein VIBNISOn1_290017 [Vibrio nigripulchritudo SOn1]